MTDEALTRSLVNAGATTSEPPWVASVALSKEEGAALVRIGDIFEAAGRIDAAAQRAVGARARDTVPSLRRLHNLLDAHGAVVVHGTPVAHDGAIIACCATCGEVAAPRDGAPASAIFNITQRSRPGVDLVQRTLTHSQLDPHTDSSLDSVPHRFIALAAVRADPCAGGYSVLARLSDITTRVGAATLATLREFPAPFAWDRDFSAEPRASHMPVLGRHDGHEIVRWHPDLLREGCQLTDARVELVSAIEDFSAAVAAASGPAFPLADGTLLVVDNHQVLHGRTTVLGGERHLKRLKIHDSTAVGDV